MQQSRSSLVFIKHSTPLNSSHRPDQFSPKFANIVASPINSHPEFRTSNHLMPEPSEETSTTLVRRRPECFFSMVYDVKSCERVLVRTQRSSTPVQDILDYSYIDIDDCSILEAKKLGIELNISYIANGTDIMQIPINTQNIGSLGKKIMDLVYTKQESELLASRPSGPSFDSKRLNIIKACYFRKLKTVKSFEEHWPKVLKALRKKCMKRSKKSTRRSQLVQCGPEKSEETQFNEQRASSFIHYQVVTLVDIDYSELERNETQCSQ